MTRAASMKSRAAVRTSGTAERHPAPKARAAASTPRPDKTEFLALLGRVGFVTKGIVYGGIGWLACRSAVAAAQNESPQGVFLLIGSRHGAWGDALLVAVLLGLASYVSWRFWEGFTGKGYAAHLSAAQNFFRYRLSPLVSGVVYLVYAGYVAVLLVAPTLNVQSAGASGASCFPACWRDSAAGTAVLALLAVAFAIGTLTQLQPARTASFAQELDDARLSRTSRVVGPMLRLAGRVGFAARAALFALVALYFARVVVGAEVGGADPQHNTVARALNALRTAPFGKPVLFGVGAGLVVYALFAAANAYFRAFPTPPPLGELRRARRPDRNRSPSSPEKRARRGYTVPPSSKPR